MTTLVGAGAVLAAACGAGAQLNFTEQFNGGVNTGAWTFGAPIETLEPTGGVGGGYLHGSGLDTTVPTLRTGNASFFTGNYRAQFVNGVAAYLIVRATDFPVSTFHPAALLVSFNGTPGDPADDWGAYTLSTSTLGTPQIWRSYGFTVPSQQTSLPAGWSFIQFGPYAPPNPDWNALIQSVDRLAFSFGDPSLFYIFQMWDIGADGISIYGMPPCFVNCDDSTTVPFLNVNDFVCFINLFASGDTHANCDGGQTPPILNVQDFACFLNLFALGCTAP